MDAILHKDLLIVPEPLDVELKWQCYHLAIEDLLDECDRCGLQLIENTKLLEG